MPATPDTFPTVGDNVTGIGTIAWVNPSNIISSDSVNATCSMLAGQTSNYLRAKNFGFSIPASATIVGITVKAFAEITGGTPNSISAALQNDLGNVFSVTLNQTVGAAGVYTWGSNSYLWLATITPAIVNNINFGVRFWYSGQRNAFIDYVTISVEYAPGTTEMPASQGAYPYNGATVTLSRTVVMPVDAGAYPYNGYAATLARARVMPAAQATTYPYTGYVATLSRDRVMPAAQPTSYPYNGYAAALSQTIVMPAAQVTAPYPYNGYSVTFARAIAMPAGAGAYAYTGYDATLDVSGGELLLIADSGSYAYTGYAATLIKITPTIVDKTLAAAKGTYQYRGSIGTGLGIIPIRIEYGDYVPGEVPDITFVAPVPPDFTIEKVTLNTVTGGATVPVTPNELDHVVDQVIGGTTTIDYQLNTSLTVVGFRSEKPEIATVDNSGRVRYASPGLANIFADEAQSTKSVFCNVNQLVGPAGYQFVDYVPGSLAYKLAHDYDNMITGTTRDVHGSLLAGWTPLKRNMNNWAIRAGVDVTPLGILNSQQAARGQLTLITPKHCILTQHNGMHASGWAQWLACDGTDRVCQRNLVADVWIQYPDLRMSDLQVFLLDSDVDEYIGHVKILPPMSVVSPRLPSTRISGYNINDQMYGLQYWLPFMWQDQRKYANCQEWNNLTNIPPSYGWNTGVRFPETFPRLEYRLKGAYSDDPAMAEMGDSGSPRNLIYNNQLIAVSMISGPVLSTMVDLINAAIDTLGNNPNNYHCDVVDLTSWPEYTT